MTTYQTLSIHTPRFQTASYNQQPDPINRVDGISPHGAEYPIRQFTLTWKAPRFNRTHNSLQTANTEELYSEFVPSSNTTVKKHQVTITGESEGVQVLRNMQLHSRALTLYPLYFSHMKTEVMTLSKN